MAAAPAAAAGGAGAGGLDEDALRERMRAEARARIERLPPVARDYLERRKRALLDAHPDFFTRELPEHAGLACARRADAIVVLLGLFVIAVLLWTEYGLDVFSLAFRSVTAALDPGPPPPPPPHHHLHL